VEIHDLHAVSLDAIAVRGTLLPFPPPLIELASNKQGFKEIWQMLAFLYPFKEPESLPQLPEPALAQHREILDRYCEKAKALAQSTYLNASREIHVSPKTGDVQADAPPQDALTGFLTIFRQFYSNDEPAAFLKVHDVLVKAVVKTFGKGDVFDELMLWRKANAQLRGHSLKVLVVRQAWPDKTKIADDYPPYPEQLISSFMYGDYIHFGDKRNELSALRSTPWDHAWSEWRLADAIGPLAHLYIGFSGIVRAATGRTSSA
jgi:hypothetical protein